VQRSVQYGIVAMNRRYHFNILEPVCYEDDLPDDMTEEDYDVWFMLSWVDIVRIGPHPARIEDNESEVDL
jgi:hypothetical protein